jgi:hypothetical protein
VRKLSIVLLAGLSLTLHSDSEIRNYLRLKVTAGKGGFETVVKKDFVYPTLDDCEQGKGKDEYCKPLLELVKEGRL